MLHFRLPYHRRINLYREIYTSVTRKSSNLIASILTVSFQTLEDVILGKLGISDDLALTLAALQLQAIHGDSTPYKEVLTE